MKFSGNVSFINIMILSKFQVDCITLTNFGSFLNIGKQEIFGKSWYTKNAGKPPKMTFFPKFFLNCFLDIEWLLKKDRYHVFEDKSIFSPCTPYPYIQTLLESFSGVFFPFIVCHTPSVGYLFLLPTVIAFSELILFSFHILLYNLLIINLSELMQEATVFCSRPFPLLLILLTV